MLFSLSYSARPANDFLGGLKVPGFGYKRTTVAVCLRTSFRVTTALCSTGLQCGQQCCVVGRYHVEFKAVCFECQQVVSLGACWLCEPPQSQVAGGRASGPTFPSSTGAPCFILFYALGFNLRGYSEKNIFTVKWSWKFGNHWPGWSLRLKRPQLKLPRRIPGSF